MTTLEDAQEWANNDAPSDDDADKKEPKHVVLVHAMQDQGFCMIDGQTPCMVKGDSITFGWDAVNSAMLEYDEECTARTRNEAIQTLKYKGRAVSVAKPRYIAFQNCVLDVETYEHFTYQQFRVLDAGIIPSVIPHNWNPEAETDNAVETLLDGVSCNNADIRGNLEELAGLCISRYQGDRASVGWLDGAGGNGKSTFFTLIAYMVGEENVSRMDLDLLHGQFYTAPLVGKLVNISDDKQDSSVSKEVVGIVKKVVTGQPIKLEQKNKDPYFANIYATLLVSSNEPPRLADTTKGSMERWHIIPFEANLRGTASADIDLKDKLQTEHAAEWMLRLAVEGLKRVLANGHMTKTARSEAALQEMAERSNNVLSFLSLHPREEFLQEPNADIWYWRYQEFCKGEGETQFKSKQFKTMVGREYGFKTVKNGRYKKGDRVVEGYGIAAEHGKKAGDQYSVFVPK